MNFALVRKVVNIFTSNEKNKVFIVLLLSILTSILEMLGVFSIVPFISLLTDPSFITSNKYVSYIISVNSMNLIESQIFFGILIIIIFVLSNILNILTLWLTINVIADFQCRISTTVLNNYLDQPYDYFIKNDHSVLSKNVLDESCILADGVIYAMMQIITKTLIILAISVLMIVVNYQLFFSSVFVFGFIYIIIFSRYRNILYNIGIKRVDANENRYKNTREVFNNVKDVKYYSNEKFYIDNFSTSAYNFAHLNAKRNLISILPRYFIEIFTFGGIFALIIYFISINESFLIHIPTISMFLFAIYRIMPQLQNIFTNTANIKSSEHVFNNIQKIINMKVIKKQNINRKTSFEKSILFKDVSFSYDNNTNILEKINLEIKKGRTYAIIGKTGTGKTTLIDALLGFYKIKSGSVMIDDKEIEANSFESINSVIGYVSQNISYIGDNILKNIAFCDNAKDLDMDRINRITSIVELDDVLDRLDNGIYQSIGDMGSMLSGGQRQRIGLARALYGNPKILILDEATNALDEKTEVKIFENINNCYPDITLIIITHRNSYISKCDEIIEIKDKKINIINNNA